MSLTSFLAQNADVRERFKLEFRKPAFTAIKPLLAPPLTTHYTTVGTAFDYLLRFVIQRLNPLTLDKGYWVAEVAADALIEADLYIKARKIIVAAKKHLHAYLQGGLLSEDLIRSALLLATIDPIYRAGVGHDNIGVIDERDMEDLQHLMAIVDENNFIARQLALINPTFGKASHLVGGADADLVIDDIIIDIKTVKKLTLDRKTYDQIMGYYTLHQIASVGELEPKLNINKVGIYFARHAYLHIMPIADMVNMETYMDFIEWFKQRAQQDFPAARLALN